MCAKIQTRNEYRCSIELNQNGKYCVRIRAFFAEHDWTLSVYFLSSNFNRAMRKLEQTLQFLQREEDRIWFWGVDRTDDPNLSAEMIGEEGLSIDRRGEFPRRSPSFAVSAERPVPAFVLAPVRRTLADSLESVHAAAGN